MRTFSLRREIALGLGVYALYLAVGRLVLRRGGRARAQTNAERIVALEKRLGVDLEPVVQRALLRFPRLVQALNVGYGLFNVTLTVGWLILLYRRRDDGYHRFRRTCLLAHVGAQPVFFLLPTAPPRVLEGFVDTFRGERARPRASVPRALLQPGRRDAEPARRIRRRHRARSSPTGPIRARFRWPRTPTLPSSRPSWPEQGTTTCSTRSRARRSGRPRGAALDSASHGLFSATGSSG